MSDEAVAETKPKRRGRPPGKTKVRPRHELTAAPVDGDYGYLDITGKDPAFNYVAMSAHDRERRGHHYEPERWSENCAHPPWVQFEESKRGQEVQVNRQLTLMKIPRERDNARKRRELETFRAAKSGVAAAPNSRGEFATVENQEERSIQTHEFRVNHIY